MERVRELKVQDRAVIEDRNRMSSAFAAWDMLIGCIAASESLS